MNPDQRTGADPGTDPATDAAAPAGGEAPGDGPGPDPDGRTGHRHDVVVVTRDDPSATTSL